MEAKKNRINNVKEQTISKSSLSWYSVWFNLFLVHRDLKISPRANATSRNVQVSASDYWLADLRDQTDPTLVNAAAVPWKNSYKYTALRVSHGLRAGV